MRFIGANMRRGGGIFGIGRGVFKNRVVYGGEKEFLQDIWGIG